MIKKEKITMILIYKNKNKNKKFEITLTSLLILNCIKTSVTFKIIYTHLTYNLIPLNQLSEIEKNTVLPLFLKQNSHFTLH